MSRILSTRFVHLTLLLVLASLACAVLTPGEPTATPEPSATDTPLPAPTKTLRPTFTPQPTSTPDTAATARYDAFYSLLEDFEGKGYITTTKGEAVDLDPFKEEWAQLGWYQWWIFDETISDFVFAAHFSWSTAHATPEISGCGFVFGIQENDDHYAVFLDKSRILFLMKRGANVYNVGRTRGVGQFSYGNPAEADFALAVKGQSAYVSVDGKTSEYTLSMDQSSAGQFGLTLLSGTNKDYGTRCEMTDVIIWTPK
jgi:hypothetical protein